MRSSRSPYWSSDGDGNYSTILSNQVDALPSDCNYEYSRACLDWVFSYGVSVNELIKNKVFWSEEKQQLIFTFYDEEGKLLLWQARNFYKGARIKYLTKGKPDGILPIYGALRDSERSILVIVEDCISAIKCSRQASSMPVLGSDINLRKLTRLVASKRPSKAFVWLDGNKYDFAQRMARRLQMLGVDASAIYTELDPKCHSDGEIATLLQNSS